MLNTESSYDAVAEEYVRRISNELKDKPLDCELLNRFATKTRDVGRVADIGCGPGHIARYLHQRGVRICGIDLSTKMVECARTLNPDIEFFQGNMNRLDVPDGAFAGVVAFYSIIHISRDQVVETIREFKRILLTGGTLLLSFHIGDGVVHLDEWWGHQVSIDFTFFQPSEIVACIEAAGLKIDEIIEREPYAPEVEHQSRRAYLFASSEGDVGNAAVS